MRESFFEFQSFRRADFHTFPAFDAALAVNPGMFKEKIAQKVILQQSQPESAVWIDGFLEFQVFESAQALPDNVNVFQITLAVFSFMGNFRNKDLFGIEFADGCGDAVQTHCICRSKNHARSFWPAPCSRAFALQTENAVAEMEHSSSLIGFKNRAVQIIQGFPELQGVVGPDMSAGFAESVNHSEEIFFRHRHVSEGMGFQFRKIHQQIDFNHFP